MIPCILYWAKNRLTGMLQFPDKHFDRLSQEAAVALSKALTARWHPSLRPLIRRPRSQSDWRISPAEL